MFVPGLASAGDIYVGVHASADRLGVLYTKAAAGANLAAAPLGAGGILGSDGSATQLSYSYGFLAGYKMPFSVTGVYAALEGDMSRHGGAPAGRLLAAQSQIGSSEAGELLAEDWTMENDRSFGLTARLGAGIPFLGTWVGPSIYALAGVRRLSGSFSTAYRGCLQSEPCSDASAITSGSGRFGTDFNGWTVGGGVETKLGLLAFRAEVRLTEYGSSGGAVSFTQALSSLPVEVNPDSLSFGASLVWYF